LATAEKLDRGYLGRIVMLTLLAPDFVEAILDGRQPAELGVHVLREGFPVEWGAEGTLRAHNLKMATEILIRLIELKREPRLWQAS
jgi:hypothetical protein